MKRSLTLVLASLFVPAVAIADEPPSSTTTTTTTTTTPPPDQTPPIVIVNPQPAPTRTIVETAPVETEVVDAWNAPVFATGAVLFMGAYGASAVVAGSTDHVGADRLYVPVAGPWLALNDWGNCPIANAACDNTTTDKVLLIADGVVQAAGIVTMLDGLFMPTHHMIVTRTAYDTKLHVTPSHRGITLYGRF